MSRPRTAGSASIDAADVVDQLDDQLGQAVGRGRLAGEEERPRRHVQRRVRPQAVVEHDDVQHVEQLPLVLVDALDLAVEDRCRGRRPARSSALSQSANRTLAARLACRNCVAEAGVVGQRARAAAAAPRSVTQPSPIASVISRARSGLASSSQRRGVTPLVLLLNRSGNISAKSATRSGPQQLGVDLRPRRWCCACRRSPGWPCAPGVPAPPRSGSSARPGPRRRGSAAGRRRGSGG